MRRWFGSKDHGLPGLGPFLPMFSILGAGFFLAGPVLARQELPGHRAYAVSSAPWVGPHDPSSRMRLSVSLALRDPEGLAAFLAHLYDPRDPSYRRFITPKEFADRFGPTPDRYQALIEHFRSMGFRITDTFANRMMVGIEGTTAQVGSEFGVRIDDYRRKDGSVFFGPDRDPSIAIDVPVVEVDGLDNEVRAHPRSRRSPRTAGPAAPRAGGSGPVVSGTSTFIGADFRNAYAPGVTLTGAGQSLALVEFAVYSPSDITTYEGKCSPPLSVPVSNIYMGGFTSTSAPDCKAADGYPEIEVALDIEVAMAMAPGLDRVVVYMEGTSTSNVLNQIASDNTCRQISCSWGWTLSNAQRAAQNTTLAEFAAQGQSYFLASGDGNPNTGVGAFTSDPPYGGSPTSSSYANDSEVTQTTVGATDLTMTGNGSVWSSEVPVAITNGWQSTGGILAGTRVGDDQATYASYQVGIDMTANRGSTVYRNVPDVSMAGLNCYVYDCTGDDNVGGTSAAAPLWAAFMALVNQQASLSGKNPVGFPNPSLYAIGKGAGFTSDFHDITTGNNGSVTQFPAVVGYDLATGWGSPKGQSLINDLVALAPTSTPTPTFSSTRTSSPTPVPTGTFTSTFTATVTATSTPSFTPTRTLTPTNSPALTATRTGTWTATGTPTSTFSTTSTPTRTPTDSPTPTPTGTFTSTATPTSSATSTRTPTATFSATASPTVSGTFSPTVTLTFSPTETPTNSPTSTRTASATRTPTPSPTATATWTDTWTPTVTSSVTATLIFSPTTTASTTPTVTATFSSTATDTANPTKTPTSSSTLAPTLSSTATAPPTATPEPTATLAAPTGFEVRVAPNAVSDGSAITFHVALASGDRIFLLIYDLAGESVYAEGRDGNGGWNDIPWPLRNQAGERVASGVYLFYVQAGDGTGGRTRSGKVLVRY